MLNRIILMGRLTRDPELRHTPQGAAVASFSLAVERDFKDKGTGEKTTDFIDVVAWRQTAEFVSRYFTKGRMAVAEGRLQIRDWTDKEGGKRRTAEVVADNVYFADSRKDGESGGSSFPSPAPASGSYAPPSLTDQFSELDGDDGDLPF
ncbi:Single-stranded DNA-binding protein [bioreactor metagenome]|uniref:Single-stranded DNA-binding protein n=1 Tax=bioreactor metagenome TaxID=1076179 RepID=A0A645DSK7_9ZZZZ